NLRASFSPNLFQKSTPPKFLVPLAELDRDSPRNRRSTRGALPPLTPVWIRLTLSGGQRGCNPPATNSSSWCLRTRVRAHSATREQALRHAPLRVAAICCPQRR